MRWAWHDVPSYRSQQHPSKPHEFPTLSKMDLASFSTSNSNCPCPNSAPQRWSSFTTFAAWCTNPGGAWWPCTKSGRPPVSIHNIKNIKWMLYNLICTHQWHDLRSRGTREYPRSPHSQSKGKTHDSAPDWTNRRTPKRWRSTHSLRVRW